MAEAKEQYPFVPRSALMLRPGHFWALPLSDGTFGCGRVIDIQKVSGMGSRSIFLAGVLDWHSSEKPTAESIAGSLCRDQGQAHLRAIRHTGGAILGWRDLMLEGIEPWLFIDAHHWRNAHVVKGLEFIRMATPSDAGLPVLSTWGYQVACVLAEKWYVKRLR